MAKKRTSKTDVEFDLSEPWEVPAHLLEALASFDQIVTQIDGAVLGGSTQRIADLDQAA